VLKIIIATSILPLTLLYNLSPAQAQFARSAIGDPSGLQLLQRGERDDREKSMEEVRSCLGADGLEEALRHGFRAINLDKSNGYAYFAVGASIMIYAPENAEDALPYLERAHTIFRIDGDVPGMEMVEEFLERIKNSTEL
jgi:hypothetical protein